MFKKILFLVSISISLSSKNISIITGSTREGRSSLKVANAIKNLAPKDKHNFEIVDIKEYDLPFLSEAATPSSTQKRNNPNVAKWSKKVSGSDAFIIIVPEYNRSYPAVLKNAIDVLFHEWKDKPVLFIGYSGGKSGGSYAIKHFEDISNELKLKMQKDNVKIPAIWKAFNSDNSFVDKAIEKNIISAINNLINRV